VSRWRCEQGGVSVDGGVAPRPCAPRRAPRRLERHRKPSASERPRPPPAKGLSAASAVSCARSRLLSSKGSLRSAGGARSATTHTTSRAASKKSKCLSGLPPRGHLVDLFSKEASLRGPSQPGDQPRVAGGCDGSTSISNSAPRYRSRSSSKRNPLPHEDLL
jgi:hypothetical protein